MTLANSDKIKSRHDYNMYIFKYVSLFTSIPMEIIIETNFYQKNIISEMLEEIIKSRFYETDYKNVTQKLLYENIDYDYAIKNGIERVAKSDVFIYKKDKSM